MLISFLFQNQQPKSYFAKRSGPLPVLNSKFNFTSTFKISFIFKFTVKFTFKFIFKFTDLPTFFRIVEHIFYACLVCLNESLEISFFLSSLWKSLKILSREHNHNKSNHTFPWRTFFLCILKLTKAFFRWKSSFLSETETPVIMDELNFYFKLRSVLSHFKENLCTSEHILGIPKLSHKMRVK